MPPAAFLVVVTISLLTIRLPSSKLRIRTKSTESAVGLCSKVRRIWNEPNKVNMILQLQITFTTFLKMANVKQPLILMPDKEPKLHLTVTVVAYLISQDSSRILEKVRLWVSQRVIILKVGKAGGHSHQDLLRQGRL